MTNIQTNPGASQPNIPVSSSLANRSLDFAAKLPSVKSNFPYDGLLLFLYFKVIVLVFACWYLYHKTASLESSLKTLEEKQTAQVRIFPQEAPAMWPPAVFPPQPPVFIPLINEKGHHDAMADFMFENTKKLLAIIEKRIEERDGFLALVWSSIG